jgi:hydrogenase maturation protease
VYGPPVVIGVGNEYRRDDGFGPRVVEELRRHDPALNLRVCDGEPTRLIDLWTGAALAVVIDVARAGGAPPGEWFEMLVPDDRLPGEPAVSSHGIGLGATVDLARALDRLPRRLVVLAAVGREFGFGTGLCAPLSTAVGPVAARARHWVVSGCPSGH